MNGQNPLLKNTHFKKWIKSALAFKLLHVVMFKYSTKEKHSTALKKKQPFTLTHKVLHSVKCVA